MRPPAIEGTRWFYLIELLVVTCHRHLDAIEIQSFLTEEQANDA